jgi:4-carboxymuconolactone decarboxylase
MARDHGVPERIISAIGAGEEPRFDSDDDRVIYDLARQLLQRGQIEHDTYAAAERILGQRGLVEIVTLCGYYTLISFLLNGFAVPLPQGEPYQWSS